MDATLYFAPGAASFLVHWLLIELEVPRDEISMPTIAAAVMIDDTTAYIRLQDFAEQTGNDLLAALQAELSERTTAREAGLMPAFEGTHEVVGNAVTEASIVLEEISS